MNPILNNPEFKGKTIIIVEDDIPSVRYYETLLTNSGADLIVFTNGKEFLNYINSGPSRIDLVIMDFLIPFINGIECVRMFRKESKNVPVILLTAYYSEQSRNEAFIAGCSEYILKPVFPEKFNFLLQKYLRPHLSYTSVN